MVSPPRQKGLREPQPNHSKRESPAATAVQNNWTLRPNTHLPYRQALNTCANIYRQFQSSFGFSLAYTHLKKPVQTGSFCRQTYFFDIHSSENGKKSVPAGFLAKVS